MKNNKIRTEDVINKIAKSKNKIITNDVIKRIAKSTSSKIQGNNPNLKNNLTDQTKLDFNQLFNLINSLDPDKANLLNKTIKALIRYINLISVISKSSAKAWQWFIWFWTNKWRKRIWMAIKFILFTCSGSVILFATDPRAVFDNILSLNWVRNNINYYSQKFFNWLLFKASQNINWDDMAKEGNKEFIVDKDKWALKLVKKSDSDQISNIVNKLIGDNLEKTPIGQNNLTDSSVIQNDPIKGEVSIIVDQNSKPWYKDWKILGGLTIGFAILGLVYCWYKYNGNLPDDSIPPASPSIDQADFKSKSCVDVVTDVLNNEENKFKHLDKTIDKPIKSTLFKNKF